MYQWRVPDVTPRLSDIDHAAVVRWLISVVTTLSGVTTSS